MQVENEYNGGDQNYLDWSIDMANNQTVQEQAYWSLCHDHTMCAKTNHRQSFKPQNKRDRAICTINGFWMDEYEYLLICIATVLLTVTTYNELEAADIFHEDGYLMFAGGSRVKFVAYVS